MLVVASSVVGEHPRSDPYSEFDVLIRQLEAERGRESGLESRSNELSANIAGLRDKIIEFVASIQSSEREIAAVEIELGQLEKSYKVAHQELIQNNRHLSASIGGLARLRRNPPEALAFTPIQKTQLRLRVAVLSLFLSALHQDGAKLKHVLSETEGLRIKRVRQHFEWTKEREKLEIERKRLEWILRRKSVLQVNIHIDRQRVAEEVESLASRAADLGELVTVLKLATGNRLKPMPPSIGQRIDAKQSQSSDDSQVVFILPTESSLPYPTWGPVIRSFGERLENGSRSQGIFIQCGSGSYVIAPREGYIVFSGDFRAYGRLLIIEHAGGYHSLLAGFARIYSEIGDWVTAGEPVGVMGDRERQGAVLYIEVRHEGEPISPREWLELLDRKVSR